MPVTRLRATFRHGRGATHEDRVTDRGNHIVRVEGTHSQVIYDITKLWISSWAKQGDEHFHISGPEWEFLACLGAVHAAGSGLLDKNPFDYSVHCHESARIISRLLQLSPELSGAPRSEAQYFAAVRQARAENLDDPLLQVVEDDEYEHSRQGRGFRGEAEVATHLKYRHLVHDGLADGMPDFLRFFGLRYARGFTDADAEGHRCSVIMSLLKAQLSDRVPTIRLANRPITMHLAARPIGEWLSASPFRASMSSLCFKKSSPGVIDLEECAQDIEERILFQYGTESERAVVFEARFGNLIQSNEYPELSLLLGALSSTKAFNQFSRLVRALCPGEPIFLQETVRQVEVKLEEKESVLSRARSADPAPDAHALITLLLAWNEDMDHFVSSKSAMADGDGGTKGARGGYSSAEVKVLAQQVLSTEFDSHISRCMALAADVKDPDRHIRVIREAIHYAAAFPLGAAPVPTHSLVGTILLSGRNLTGLHKGVPCLLEARIHLAQYYTRALIFGEGLGITEVDYKVKNIRLPATVCALFTALKLEDVDILNSITYFLKGERSSTEYEFVPPGDEITVATHTLQLRMTMPNLLEMFGLPGTGDRTYVDVQDKVTELVVAGDFLNEELAPDFVANLSSIMARAMEVLASHLQSSYYTRNADRPFSRDALAMAPDIYDHIADCHQMLGDFLRFNNLLPSLFATSGAKRQSSGAAVPRAATPSGDLSSEISSLEYSVLHVCAHSLDL